MTEKMLSQAMLNQALSTYPEEALAEAQYDLMFSQFHDILPGSSVQSAEESSLRMLDHGLEICSRWKTKALFAMAGKEDPVEEGTLPVFVYNPHPYELFTWIECEVQLASQNRQEDLFFDLDIVDESGKILLSQIEKETSNLTLDWRKRIVFLANLAPAQMNRFTCRLKPVPNHRIPMSIPPSWKKESPSWGDNGDIVWNGNNLNIRINGKTGLIDTYRVDGKDYLKEGACQGMVIQDDSDAWGSKVISFRTLAGTFRLMNAQEAAQYSGHHTSSLPPVRIVEEGEARIVVEALFIYNSSVIRQRYEIPKQGTEIGVSLRVHWNEPDRMLKWSLPAAFTGNYIGQDICGRNALTEDGNEAVAHKWTAVVSRSEDLALICYNDSVYGSDYCDGEMRMSLLRSPAYSSLTLGKRPQVLQDRSISRIDQGVREYRFWISGGSAAQLLENADTEALIRHEKPMALSFFPTGVVKQRTVRRTASQPSIVISDSSVQLMAMKKADSADTIIIRLFESTGRGRTCTIEVPLLNTRINAEFGNYEIKTYRISLVDGTYVETDLSENELSCSVGDALQSPFKANQSPTAREAAPNQSDGASREWNL
jgi:alpha-mannosidase